MNDVPVPADAGYTITANFAPKKISGNSACNDYNGTYALTGQRGFEILGELVTTSKFCDDNANAAEAKYLGSLVQVTRWTFNSETPPTRLTLRNDDGSISLVYSCQPPGCPSAQALFEASALNFGSAVAAAPSPPLREPGRTTLVFWWSAEPAAPAGRLPSVRSRGRRRARRCGARRT